MPEESPQDADISARVRRYSSSRVAWTTSELTNAMIPQAIAPRHATITAIASSSVLMVSPKITMAAIVATIGLLAIIAGEDVVIGPARNATAVKATVEIATMIVM